MLQELETQEMVRQSHRFNVGEYECIVMLLHVFHFEFPGLGYVTEQAGALKWKPTDLRG